MDLSSTTPTAIATATIKTPDTDTESPSEPKSTTRSLIFTNGALKPHHHHHSPVPPPPPPPPPQMVAGYKECLKNHAASIGGHALDGCGEFMPSPSSNPSDPSSLKCAACGCHRNFHRRHDLDEHVIKFKPKILNVHRRFPPGLPASAHHHHQSSSPSPSQSPSSSPGPTLSPHSPPPVSHLPPSYFASPPHMLLALSGGFSGLPSDDQQQHHPGLNPTALVSVKSPQNHPNGRKRSRTKFSQEQKEKMCLFAEKVGWRMQKSDERLVEEFCNEVGVGRGVLKVWMHNNKHTLKKRSAERGVEHQITHSNVNEIRNGGEGAGDIAQNTNYNNAHHQNEGSRASFHLSNNGSSSSS